MCLILGYPVDILAGIDFGEMNNGPAHMPPAPVLPDIPRPRWIDLYVIVKVVLGIYLFAENLPWQVQIAGVYIFCYFLNGNPFVIHF